MDYDLELRIASLVDDLKQAVNRLDEALAAEPTQLHKDAAIQRFEFTFELAWKLMQEADDYLGKKVFGPKPSIRTAAEKELIGDPEAWLEFLKWRNITTHTYKQYEADKIYEAIKNFPKPVQELIAAVEKVITPTTV
jgi:nucleotidyltransferase substrate binding protein (TIGR01987 family)